MDYKAMYYRLAGKVADAIDILVEAQLECERAAMQEELPGIELLKPERGDEKPS